MLKNKNTAVLIMGYVCLTGEAPAQLPQLSDNERSIALNCVSAYPFPERQQQESCFASLLKDGRTPDEIRAFVAGMRAQRQRQQEQIAAKIAADQEQRMAAAERAAKERREGEARERSQCAAKAQLAASEVALVDAEEIRMGMSEAALLCSWGRPEDIHRSVGSWGERKQYVYGDGVYVYVDNGKITSWQD